ncbi:MAG: hypothetical protein V1925_04870 [Candidatus Omnitrophota bacterium]
MNITISHKTNFIGILALASGAFIEFWFLTIGLYITLFSYDTSKEITDFLFLILGIILGLMFFLGGLGVLRRRLRLRMLLVVDLYLGAAVMAFIFIMNISSGLIEMRHQSFEFLPWIGGAIFCLLIGVALAFQALFLNRADVKELFKIE